MSIIMCVKNVFLDLWAKATSKKKLHVYVRCKRGKKKAMCIYIVKRKKKKYKNRGHPDLNRGPLDLQSNALPLSYTPTSDNWS